MNHTKATTIKGDFYEKNAKRLYATHLDNPKELRKLFLILVKNNNVLRNNIQFYEELVEMHEKDESPEITNLNQSIINNQSVIKQYEEKCRNLEKEIYDISCDNETIKEEYETLQQEKEEKWIEQIAPVEDNIRKAYQDEIDKLKKEVSRLNKVNDNQSKLIRTLRNNKK